MNEKSLRKCTDKITDIMKEYLINDDLALAFGITHDDVRCLTQNIIEDYIIHDVKRFFESDPAASSEDILIDAYKGIDAVIYFRSAHAIYYHLAEKLYEDIDEEDELNRARKVFFQTRGRLISEKGAKETTIEIHPSAKIGKGLVIDHGVNTKIGYHEKWGNDNLTTVIGETCVLGENVTILNGVTLGAKHVDDSRDEKHGKRHPTIGNDVVICGGARVLGNVEIGDRTFIAPFCLITHDIPADSKVLMINQLQIEKNDSIKGKIIYGLNCKDDIIEIFGEGLKCREIFVVDEKFQVVDEYSCKIILNDSNCIRIKVQSKFTNNVVLEKSKVCSLAIEFIQGRYTYIIRPFVLCKVIQYICSNEGEEY